MTYELTDAGRALLPGARTDQAVGRGALQLRSGLGDANLRVLQARLDIENFVIGGISEEMARECARQLARYEDPELELVGAGLPQLVRLLPLLGADDIAADQVLKWWSAPTWDPPPSAPIGIGEDGVAVIDLVRDGPHGLIGGTTGSGESELLRSLVAGLSARVDPDHLVFVLIDYKGGSAFDDCARLPHTVGLVTDLDGHLRERALKSLEAELAYRERLLREVGAQDLREYLRMGAPLGPLPRLAVVIDEFATLAAELPEFINALVGIAQRGRSLGVHLILATQRPSGAVNANIKANTNLRIALRVQDAGDSQDIIDSKDAASISRSTPGRAYIRRGPGDVVLVQTALSTATPSGRRSAAVRLEPFSFGPTPSNRPLEEGDDDESATDLARLVNAVEAAFIGSGMQQPRKPWLEMLPERIELETILTAADAPDVVPLGLADDPERQRQIPVGWDPAEGHLALFGMVGSGTTTAMLAVVRSLVERCPPQECHIYGLDFGAGGLAPLGALPHVGAVIAANDYEAQFRLIRYLRREVERRRTLTPAARVGEPRIVVLIDGNRVLSGGTRRDRGCRDGGRLPSCVLGGPSRRRSVRASRRLAGRAADATGLTGQPEGAVPPRRPQGFAAIGMRARELPTFVPGRAIHAQSKLVIQVGHPGDDLHALGAELKQRWPESRPTPRIASLATELRYENLPGGAKLSPPPSS